MAQNLIKCTVCSTYKHARNFHKNKSKSSGTNSECKSCHNIQAKIYWDKNKERRREIARAYCLRNREKLRVKSRANYAADPSRRIWGRTYARQNSLRKRAHAYGTTVEYLESVFKAQKGCCAICKQRGRLAKTNDEEKLSQILVIDHDHKTGKVRGLLCSLCNSGIGKLKEKKRILLRAIKYLESYA